MNSKNLSTNLPVSGLPYTSNKMVIIMKTLITKLNKLALACVMSSVFLVANTYADDTEIFVQQAADTTGTPNILFMMDNSASMSLSFSYVAGYDNSSVAANAGCLNDKIYFSDATNNQIPDCNSNTDYFDPAVLQCLAISEALFRDGTFFTRLIQWNPLINEWGTLKNDLTLPSNMYQTPVIDCLPDAGIHGDSKTALVRKAANGALSFIEGSPATTEDEFFVSNSGAVSPDRVIVDPVTGLTKTVKIQNPYSNTRDPSIRFVDGVDASGNLLPATLDTLYTLYTGQFLNYANTIDKKDPDLFVDTTGLRVLSDTLSKIIDDDAYLGMNLGMMKFNKKSGGGVHFPVIAIKDYPGIATVDEVRAEIKTLLSPASFQKTNNKPLADTLYEAHQYYRGLEPKEGKGDGVDKASPLKLITDTYAKNGDYLSPIKPGSGTCQDNHLVIVSRGSPSGDNKLQSYTNNITSQDGKVLAAVQGACPDGVGDQKTCMDDLSKFMYEHDLSPVANGQNNDGSPVVQNIITHGVTLGTSVEEIEFASLVHGGGNFLKVSNPKTLEEELKKLFDDIIKKNSTFVTPSISVNSFNRLQNLNELYYSLFQPKKAQIWDGNLKKYKLTKGVITDKNGDPAVDTTTGLFNESSQSYWSAEIDGDEAGLGGFASNLTVLRNVFTDFDTSAGLRTTVNLLNESNSKITPAMLGITSGTAAEQGALRTSVLKWARGVNDDDSMNKFIGDPLHTTPVIFTYGKSKVGIGDAAVESFDQALFFGTNNGFIHGVDVNPGDGNDPTSGMEYFAYSPSELLTGFAKRYENPESSPFTKAYGIDGPLTGWLDDTDKDFLVDSGESAYLYATMRRGGRNIYALDVANRENPKLAWKIRGGVDSGFAELGQTWSAVQYSKIVDTQATDGYRDVVFFAGGYDPNQDAASSGSLEPASSASATMGRAIYMVDAKTGSLIWTASYSGSGADLELSDMTYSIPSNLKLIDLNTDGLADRIYVGDLGGQIWRFDISASDLSGFDIHGGVVAKLNQPDATTAADPTKNLRFYAAPSVSLVSNDTYGTYLSLAIGSGYRAHPLDQTLQDKFFMIKDYYVNGPQLDINDEPVYNSVVYNNSTDLLNISDIVEPTFKQLDGKKGWFIDFATSGEKVLTSAITADNKIFFTTYYPTNSLAVKSCEPNGQLGRARLYAISLISGGVIAEPELDDNGDEIPQTTEDRFKDLETPGILPSPRLLTEAIEPPDPADPNAGNAADPNCISATQATLIVGTELANPNICTAPVRTYWQRY